MSVLLHPNIKSRSSDLAEKFAAAKPFRHVVIDDFLTSEAIESLISEFPAFDPRKALNEVGEVGRKAVVSDVRSIGSTYKALDALIQGSAFLAFIAQISGIPHLLYDPEYVGGGTHENLDGQDLDVHVDFNYHPGRDWHRRLNLILFLNPEWDQRWGGSLELHKDPWNTEDDEIATVVPLANRAVLFETTEHSWHGFSRITLPPERQDLSRKSIAVYYYTAERPAAESAPSHGTVYVPRPLPDHLQPGYTLRDEDVNALQVLWARRNAQLRFLYERELEFSQALARIRNSPSFRLGRALTWPARLLTRRLS